MTDSAAAGAAATASTTAAAAGEATAGAAVNVDARMSVTSRVLAELAAGGTVEAVAVRCGTSAIFVKTMLDHYQRLGMLAEASSLCSSGLGACSAPADALSMEAQVHCAGCPLTIRRK